MNAMKHIPCWNVPLVPEIHHHHYTITASEGSSVIVGCSGQTIVGGNYNTGAMDEMETEMLRLFRSFDMRRKTEAMACLFKIEDNMKGVDNLG